MEYKLINKGRIKIHYILTDKFKTNVVGIKFRNNVSKDTITKRSILPGVLGIATKEYPSQKLISKKLDKLYGATLGFSPSKVGNNSIMNFAINFVNEKYASETLTEDIFKFLNEVFFNPLVENESFDEKILKEEKRILHEEIDSIYENKTKFALTRLIDNMCPDEKYSIPSQGIKEDIDQITGNDLYKSYLEYLENDEIHIILCGDFKENDTTKLIEKYLPFTSNNVEYDAFDYEDKEITKPNEVIEYESVSQSKLNIGFRTNVRANDKDYYAMIMYNSILGAFPHSKLFTNVRERDSLAYYVVSRIDSYKGLLIIYAGIQDTDYKKAVDVITEQINEMNSGNISQEEYELTIKALVNDYREMADSPVGMVNNAFTNILLEREFDVDYQIQKIKEVTIKDIIKVGNKIKLDTTYLLSSEVK